MSRARGAVGLYLDTSCLLKLFFSEPESRRVMELLATETRVVVSELGWLEASVQIRGRLHAGLLSRARAKRLTEQLARTLEVEPFELMPMPTDSVNRAREVSDRGVVHCRTLDLLHLAAMQSERLERLLTNDNAQAEAARGLGLTVLLPRVSLPLTPPRRAASDSRP
jgi:predicted nucleic acid-binding protein